MSEEMTREETKVKTFDVLRFIADNAGLSIFEAIEKAYNMGLSEQEPKTDKENVHREREQAYMQGYEDACKKYRQEPCSDTISRQAAISAILTKYTEYERLKMLHFTPNIIKQECADLLTDLPSVTPKQRTGKWIPTAFMKICSECGNGSFDVNSFTFCPWCGAKMVEPQESEEVNG